MPSHYAHYRFGFQAIPTLPADARRTIRRFRQLYDVGLHGPDLFFYYNPLAKTPIGNLGTKFHDQTGAEFFTRAARSLRLSPSEAALAYLYGVLGHYALDSVCHPFVNAQHAAGVVDHVELETEFDRFLLTTDGKIPPQSQDLSLHMRLTPGEQETVAAFYRPAKAGHIRRCVRNMAFFTKLLATPDGAGRKTMEQGIRKAAPGLAGVLMTEAPNPRCCQMDDLLLERYNQALANYPRLIEQLQANLARGQEFGPEFDPTFG